MGQTIIRVEVNKSVRFHFVTLWVFNEKMRCLNGRFSIFNVGCFIALTVFPLRGSSGLSA